MTNKNHKVQILTAVRDLLQNAAVNTQEDIRQHLELQGLSVNQAMISRILHQLGAVKMIEDAQTVYRLPTELATVSTKNSLSQLVLSIEHNQMLVVIHTAPGSAQLVARLLDQSKQSDILGTVAGDDTIFIAPRDVAQIQTLARDIATRLLD